MSYWNYVVAAYAVFAIVLLWDWVVPWLQLRRELRIAKLRAARTADNTGKDTGSPLLRG